MVTKAKEEELSKFKSLGVYDEIADVGQNDITSRWVVTETTGSQCTERKCKARLLARGFEENFDANVE